MNALHAKKMKEEEDRALANFCPEFQKGNTLKNFPLDKVGVFLLCDQDHPTKYCPSVSRLKAIYMEAGTEGEFVCFISQKHPWKPRPSGTILVPMQTFNPYWNNSQIHQSQVSQVAQVQQNSQPWYPPMPQQIWAPPYPQNSPWKSN